MSSASTLLSPPWNVIRQLRGSRAERAEHHALELELAGYTSEKDLIELAAILDRYSDAEGEDIRHILGARNWRQGVRG
jgi:hypothetical protein